MVSIYEWFRMKHTLDFRYSISHYGWTLSILRERFRAMFANPDSRYNFAIYKPKIYNNG